MPPNVPFAFDVANWTWIPDIPGQPGATNHCSIVYPDWGLQRIKVAVIRCVLQKVPGVAALPQVRFRRFWGDPPNIQYAQIGPDLTYTTDLSITINNIGAEVSADFQAMEGHTTQQITVDVKGKAVMYLARYEVVYEIDDHMELIDSHGSRVTNLESATGTHLQLIDSLGDRVTVLESVTADDHIEMITNLQHRMTAMEDGIRPLAVSIGALADLVEQIAAKYRVVG